MYHRALYRALKHAPPSTLDSQRQQVKRSMPAVGNPMPEIYRAPSHGWTPKHVFAARPTYTSATSQNLNFSPKAIHHHARHLAAALTSTGLLFDLRIANIGNFSQFNFSAKNDSISASVTFQNSNFPPNLCTTARYRAAALASTCLLLGHHRSLLNIQISRQNFSQTILRPVRLVTRSKKSALPTVT